jgi:hypothetical protein
VALVEVFVLQSSVLDVAIGVIFGFLAVSLITSAIVEAINSVFKLRSVTLLSGIKDLVNDPDFTGLAKTLYEHAAINPRGFSPSAAATAAAKGNAAAVDRAGTAAPEKNKPAYIDPRQFANALLDITGISKAAGAAPAPGPAAVRAFQTALAANVAAVANPQIKALLEGILNRTNGDIALVRHEVATWFDGAMDRVGGSFKRQTQLFSFLIALAVACLLNVDTIHLATALWEHPAVVDQLKLPDSVKTSLLTVDPGQDVAAYQKKQAALQEDAARNIAAALDNSLPVGWSPGEFLQAYSPDQKQWLHFWEVNWWAPILGWVATAIATLFGAPFWFDALQSFVRLKGSGPSPQEKLDGSAASA